MSECLHCGETEKRLVKHHIDYEMDETVLLCASCHIKLHKGSIKSNIPAPSNPIPSIGLKLTKSMYNDLKKKSDDLGGVGISNVVRMAITEYLKGE